ncbi:MAG TPA: ATPase domain-containing protein [Candidatus Binatia bacterium]|jgi:circadian clock protein KaiC|nr:ATPase domain-containing protein [Candidatus Binatia bacterium]
MVSERISTGIAGLDRLLHGGYIKGRSHLLTGDTGTGKTIACLQFLIHSLNLGEKAVYVTVDERPAEILESGASFSWDFQQHIQDKNLVILDASPYFGARSGSEKGIDPQKIVADLGSYARRLGATLLIIDPITPLILPTDASSSSQDQGRSLMQLIQSQLNTTNLFTAHLTAAAQSSSNGIEQFLASGVLVFKTVELNGRFERTLTIRKMRGTAVEPADYPFVLVQNDGIVLADRSAGITSARDGEAQILEYFAPAKKQP